MLSGIGKDPDLQKYQECIDRADVFIQDILPQLGPICLQDYGNLNQLCILLRELKSEKPDATT